MHGEAVWMSGQVFDRTGTTVLRMPEGTAADGAVPSGPHPSGPASPPGTAAPSGTAAGSAPAEHGVCVFDSLLTLTSWNDEFFTLMGYPAGLAKVGTPWAAFRDHDMAAGETAPPGLDIQVRDSLESSIRPLSHSIRWSRLNGRTVEFGLHPMPHGGFVAVFTDLTGLLHQENWLLRDAQRYALAVEGGKAAIWDWDLKTGRIFYSPNTHGMLGVTPDILGDDPEAMLAFIHPEDRKPWRQAIVKFIRDPGQAAFNHVHRQLTATGQLLWIRSRAVAERDETGQAFRVVGSNTDISDIKRAEEQALRSAFEDDLTGLANRALFVDRAGQALRRMKRDATRLFAVLFLNLDRFRTINETLGHDAGDALLRAVADRLREVLRPSDTVARLNGDEFTVLLEDLDSQARTLQVAGRLQQAIGQPIECGGQELYPTISIGIALGRPDYARPEELLGDADIALNHAKRGGKAQYVMFSDSMRSTVTDRLSIETGLRKAVDRGELELFYQPIIRLESEQVAGFEALMRWRHPDRGMISPGEFIPVAEETGLIVPLGRFALECGARQLVAWNRDRTGAPLFMSVNVSNRQFVNHDLIGDVQAVIEQSGIAPALLKIEITESLIMSNPDLAAARLQELKQLGVTLSLDDFGTGYSSLSYLHRFPFDTLKIDRSFVNTMLENPESMVIVRAIAGLATNLGMDIVAEGAEEAAEVAELRKLGCLYCQGYYFGRPTPAAQASALVAA